MHLHIRSPIRDFPVDCLVEIDADETVETLYGLIFSMCPELGNEFRLVHKGSFMENEWKLDSAGVTSGDIIAVARKRLSAPAARIGHPADETRTHDDYLGHRFRGVSPHYASTALLEEIQASGLERDAAVYEMEPLVIRPKGAHLICPRDGRMGAAYIDCVNGADNAGLSTFMLSYTWGYSVLDIANTLLSFCQLKNIDSKRVFFWICCLCINQHRVKEAEERGELIPFEEFQRSFAERVLGIGQVVAMMAPWRAPKYIKRVWCDFEIFTAITQGSDRCQVHVAMPPNETDNMLCTMRGDTNFVCGEVWRVLGGLKIEDAEASVEEDRRRILALVADGPGFHILNGKVAGYLQAWVVDTCCQELERCLRTRDAAAANVCACVTNLLIQAGQLERAAEFLERTCQVVNTLGKMETKSGATLIQSQGKVEYLRGHLSSAQANYQAAKLVYEKTGTLETFSGAELLHDMGQLRRDLGDFQGALAALEEADELYRKAGSTHVLSTKLALGQTKSRLGDPSGALSAFLEAKELLVADGELETPNGATLLLDIGQAQLFLGDYMGAKISTEQAKLVFEKTATLDSQMGAAALLVLGQVKGVLGDSDNSIADFEQARDILEKTQALESPNGVGVLAALGNAKCNRGDLDGAMTILEIAKMICENLGILQTENGRHVMELQQKVMALQLFRSCLTPK